MNKVLIQILRDLLQTRPNRTVWIVFLLSLLITQGIAYRIYVVEKEYEFLLVKKEAEHIKNQLEDAINQSINASKILAFLIEQHLVDAYFERVSGELISQNDFVDALQLVRDNTIIKTYPLKGNEVVIGYSVLNDSAHRKEAMKALKRRQLYFEGPIRLKQGGEGIIGRLPVYRNNEFWGFSAVIIRKEKLLKAIGTDNTGMNDTYMYQLVKSGGGTANYNQMFESRKDFNEGVFYKNHLAVGDWDVYAKLRHSDYLSRALQFSFMGLLFSLLFAVFLWHLSIQPQRLQMLVDEKTNALDRLNRELENRAQELTASNKELEQFAYIASHDLQEPLRTVSSFLSQIERKYADLLDEKGKQYIRFAVDGAKRMRSIILDVLEFSRVGKYSDPPETIDLNVLLDEVCGTLQQTISEKRAIIQYGVLPKIFTHRSPMQQVFQNLIGNSLKYCKEGVKPTVRVSVLRLNNKWLFSVEDNGIGIDEEYSEKIFVIFQRLHTDDEYEGTGMGLAIVKKSIENLGGKVWVESGSDSGSTFYFTLPFMTANLPGSEENG
ncbi:Bacteriophytochrome [Flavobacterium limnosediminis JC2902]|uniref:histidine kinase n=1 Tax=Flavobacterium limnosediminis JC2902 TaxID=1341181 RepID=V6SH53_9FLAO|nr:ATP-binding protein [Flavobacterium limnosediminis]ESU25774.1 Bacteriophytochrome [Flavobacterium limnosediminis JC2902]